MEERHLSRADTSRDIGDKISAGVAPQDPGKPLPVEDTIIHFQAERVLRTNRAEKRKPNLPAVRMTGQHHIDAKTGRDSRDLRRVGKEKLELALWRSPQAALYIRKAIIRVVRSRDREGFAAQDNRSVFIDQDLEIAGTKPLDKGAALLSPYLVLAVAQGDKGRAVREQFPNPAADVKGDRPALLPRDQVAVPDNDVRALHRFQQFQKPLFAPPPVGGMKIGEEKDR